MRMLGLIAATSTLVSACGSDGPAAAPVEENRAASANAATPVPPGPAPAVAPGGNLQSAGDGRGNKAEPADAEAAAPAPGPAIAASPCLVQEGKPVRAAAFRALGTEPFWNARIEGRCVTYSNPEDPDGTRIWTRFTAARGGGSWSGSLGGKPFELRIRPGPGCSDGMSDRVYPLAAELIVAGERRQGCAAPAG